MRHAGSSTKWLAEYLFDIPNQLKRGRGVAAPRRSEGAKERDQVALLLAS
jgi:hypothetical protein